MTFNAANRKDVRRAEKASHRADLDRLEFVRTGMSTAPGRSWFYQLLASCHVFVVNPPTNPYVTAFSEGERNIGVRIYTDIMLASPNEYILMINEANHRELSNARSDPDSYPDAPTDDYSSGEHPGSPSTLRGDPGSPGDSVDDTDGWPDHLIGLHDD